MKPVCSGDKCDSVGVSSGAELEVVQLKTRPAGYGDLKARRLDRFQRESSKASPINTSIAKILRPGLSFLNTRSGSSH